jgi:hypothetical protein
MGSHCGRERRKATPKLVLKFYDSCYGGKQRISIVCDTDCEQRIDTDTKDGKVKINWEKVGKECYSEMVNQEITNRKVMEEAQKLESNYGIENMIIEISNILRDSAKKNVHLKKVKRRNYLNFKYGIMIFPMHEMKQTNIN